ncbi:MAG: HlyD family efflux transporter periplasmic adaptor subunit [Crocinitomix sp.]|nr:HlyD family efflux transporter periplasmic adaptor subunit [Crocinitomix sp.]
MKLRHIIIITIFVSINVLVVTTLNFAGASKAEEVDKKPIFYPTLNGTTISNSEENFKIIGFGTVSSFNEMDVACEVQGKLIQGKQNLKPGIKFRKGELLFSINDAEARYNLRARKSGFINVIANILPDLKIDFPDQFKKWENYVGSIKLNATLPQLPAWSSTKEKIFISTRNVLTEYFAIKSLEEQLRKFRVYAPFSGVVTDVYATNHSVVNPGTKIMRLVETGNFEIPVSIPTNQSAAIAIGTEVTIYTTSGVLKGSGAVVRISEVINKNTQSIDVYVRPKSIEGATFTEGEYVEVELNRAETHKGVRLPNNAIQNNYVYTYSKIDSVLTKQAVQVLNTNDQGAFVQGLQNNTIVITQEVLNYTDTSKFKVLIH